MCSGADAFFEAKKEEFLRESSGEAQDSPGEAFREALGRFTGEVAYAGAVRKLHAQGYPPEEIRKQLHYPATPEQIRAVIEAQEAAKSTEAPADATSGSADAPVHYEIVREFDALGRPSFRRRPVKGD